jgi:hypothetical protein
MVKKTVYTSQEEDSLKMKGGIHNAAANDDFILRCFNVSLRRSLWRRIDTRAHEGAGQFHKGESRDEI